MELIYNIDNAILQFIQENLRCTAMDQIFVFITKLGDNGSIWICAAIILLLFKKTRKCGVLILLTVIFAFLFGDKLLKNIVGRDRPFLAYPLFAESELLIKAPRGFSFPSGHTSSSFGAAMSIFIYNKKIGITAFFIAGLIAFSRMYLYVHYPSDVLAGMIFGILMCISAKLLIDYFYKTLESKRKNNL